MLTISYLEQMGTEVGFEPTIIVLETIALDRTKLHGIKLERIVRFELTPYGLEGRHTTFVLYPHYFGASWENRTPVPGLKAQCSNH